MARRREYCHFAESGSVCIKKVRFDVSGTRVCSEHVGAQFLAVEKASQTPTVVSVPVAETYR